MMKVCINCYTENPLDAVLCSECGMSLTRAPTGEAAMKLKEKAMRPVEEMAAGLEQPSIGETPTAQSRLAYQLAAVVLFLGVLVNITSVLVDVLVAGGTSAVTSIVPIVIDSALAIGLLQLRGGARLWVLVRAVLGAIVWPILLFLSNDALTAIFMSVMQWGYCVALIVLLTGQSKTWRLVLGVGIYVVFTLLPFGFLLLLIVLGSLLGVMPTSTVIPTPVPTMPTSQYPPEAYTQGFHHYSRGEYEEAIADFTEAISLAPNFLPSYISRGSAYRELGEYEDSMADYNEAIRLDPDYSRAYYSRGDLYRELGEYEEAIADFTEAIRLEPTFLPSYVGRGNAYRTLGEYEEAIADFEAYLRLAPPDAEFRAQAQQYVDEMRGQ